MLAPFWLEDDSEYIYYYYGITRQIKYVCIQGVPLQSLELWLLKAILNIISSLEQGAWKKSIIFFHQNKNCEIILNDTFCDL